MRQFVALCKRAWSLCKCKHCKAPRKVREKKHSKSATRQEFKREIKKELQDDNGY